MTGLYREFIETQSRSLEVMKDAKGANFGTDREPRVDFSLSILFQSQLNRREEKDDVNGHVNGVNGVDEDDDVTVERGQPFSASSSSSGRSSRPSSFRP